MFKISIHHNRPVRHYIIANRFVLSEIARVQLKNHKIYILSMGHEFMGPTAYGGTNSRTAVSISSVSECSFWSHRETIKWNGPSWQPLAPYMAYQLNSVVDGLYQLNVEWWWISNDLFTYHEDSINIDRRTYILYIECVLFLWLGYWLIAFCKWTSLKRSKRFTQKVLIGQLKINYPDGNRQFTNITLYFGAHKKMEKN